MQSAHALCPLPHFALLLLSGNMSDLCHRRCMRGERTGENNGQASGAQAGEKSVPSTKG